MNYYFEISLTGKCNINCSYCFENNTYLYNNKGVKNHFKKTTTSFNTIDSILNIIKYYQEKKDSKIEIFIYGGEPFFEKNYLLYLLKEFKKILELDKLNDITLVTNGTIYDIDILNSFSFFKKKAYLDISGHFIGKESLFRDEFKYFLNKVVKSFSNINITVHFVVTSINMIYLFDIIKYYNSILNSKNNLILGIDYMPTSKWTKMNIQKLFEIINKVSLLKASLKFNIQYENSTCEIDSNTLTRGKNTKGISILHNGDISGCQYFTFSKNITYEKYNKLLIGNVINSNIFFLIDEYFTKKSMRYCDLIDKDGEIMGECYIKNINFILMNKYIYNKLR